MRNIIVSVAPVSLEPDCDANKVLSPDQIAEEVYGCYKSGASVVHLHVRDKEGFPTENLNMFSTTLSLMREKCDIIIQGSTGGQSDLSLDQRCVSLNDSRVQMGSLNMGSTNLGEGVYINTVSDIKYWADKMINQNIVPELEVFDCSMVYTSIKLAEQGFIKGKLNFGIALGFESSSPSNITMLKNIADIIPKDAGWGLIHHGMQDFDLLASAIALGADFVRVGFEDSLFYKGNKKARSNIELVESLVDLIHIMGHNVATVEQAKQMIGVKR